MITVRKIYLLTVASILLLANVSVQEVNAQKFTLSNNLLYDATLTPNLRLGARLSEQWSLGLTAGYHPWIGPRRTLLDRFGECPSFLWLQSHLQPLQHR